MRYRLLICALILGLTGCLPGYTPTSTKTLPGASKTPTLIQTVTPTVISTPTPTVKARPSITAVVPTPTTCSSSSLQLTYITILPSGNYGVYAIDTGNLETQQPCFGKPKLLFQTQFPIYSITWSPDGIRVAFVGLGENNSNNIFIADWDGQNLTNITNTHWNEDAGFPVWSSDGKKIAYIFVERFSSSYIRISDPDGKNVTQILLDKNIPDSFYWVPNSNYIAYIINFPSHIVIAALNGDIIYKYPSNPSQFNLIADLSFAPDGQRLVFHGENFSKEDVFLMDIYIVNIDGSGEQNLTNGMYHNHTPRWSPLFDWIAFTSDLGRLGHVFLIKPDGTQRIQVTHGTSDVFDPAWRDVGSQ